MNKMDIIFGTMVSLIGLLGLIDTLYLFGAMIGFGLATILFGVISE